MQLMQTMDLFEVLSIPDKEFDKSALFDVLGNEKFVVVYDFGRCSSYLGMENLNSNDKIRNITSTIPGLKIERPEAPLTRNAKNLVVLSAYRNIDEDEEDPDLFKDIFDIDLHQGTLTIGFVPLGLSQLKESKEYIESLLSKRDGKETVSMLSDVFSKRINASTHRENFNESEELMLLSNILESINKSILRNGMAYRVYFIVDDASGKIEKYLSSRFLILSRTQLQESSILLERVEEKVRVLPIGIDMSRILLNFRGDLAFSYTLPTTPARSKGTVELGTYLKEAVSETNNIISIDPSSLNLGMMITGLPGAGKTKEAMTIIDSVRKSASSSPGIAIISPTDEWNDFALSNGMYLIRLYDDSTPVNFFHCPIKDRVKFYEDLAMILSSASDAGPYRNPMQKCMQNAFRKVYAVADNPDPTLVYGEIEESVIKLHAKRSNTGIKYTKHGENIHSALENLRSILNRPEYAAENGVAIEDLIDKGVVFDMSHVSNSTKPYLYALVLNQIYSLASQFSTDNDSNLKLLICLEEAQLVFRDEEAAAVEDLKYRIQDFRKQGIGLMLLTHNVSDIEASIRRLCQLKLYLKQAPDVAEIAAEDLVFTYAEEEQVVQKLKHLDSRIGALNYLIKHGSEKLSQDTVFIRTKAYDCAKKVRQHNPIEDYLDKKNLSAPERIKCKITLQAVISEQSKFTRNLFALRKISIRYLHEEIAETVISTNSAPVNFELMEGKEYTVQLLDKKGKILYEAKIAAKPDITLMLTDELMTSE